MAIAFEASFPGTPLAVRALRREHAGLANDCGMDAEGIAAVRLAVTEAATNAVLHAYAAAQGELRVTAAIQDGELTIVIGTRAADSSTNATARTLGRPRHRRERRAGPKDRQGRARYEIHMGFPCPNAG